MNKVAVHIYKSSGASMVIIINYTYIEEVYLKLKKKEKHKT